MAGCQIRRPIAGRIRMLALAAGVAAVALLAGCRQSGEGQQVFVALPQPGEGWVWQTFVPPTDTVNPRGDTMNLSAEFALIGYGSERTVKVVLARYYPDHSGLDEPLAVVWKTFTSDLLDSTRVKYDFPDVVLSRLGDTPFAFYFFVEGPVACDIVVEKTSALADGCLYLQDRFDRTPTAVGKSLFTVQAE